MEDLINRSLVLCRWPLSLGLVICPYIVDNGEYRMGNSTKEADMKQVVTRTDGVFLRALSAAITTKSPLILSSLV